MSGASGAAQSYVGAEAIDEPLAPAARMGPSQDYDVAEPELDDSRLCGRHGVGVGVGGNRVLHNGRSDYQSRGCASRGIRV